MDPRRNLFIVAIFGLISIGIILSFAWVAMTFLSRDISQVITQIQDQETREDPGALISTTMHSKVGVLLDEIPQSERNHLVQELFIKPESYWQERAIRQIRFTTLRRNYGATYGETSIPLPPEELWQVSITGPVKREVVDGHDVMTVEYSFSSTLLTDKQSPSRSAKALGGIGGKYVDKLMLPLDPEFVFQRTGFACMNESESPPNSIDAEEADFYYDQKCRVEAKLTNIGCHQTEMPTMSCEEAVKAYIGAARPTMTFERIPWDDALAARVRIGEVTNPSGPDLQPVQSRFEEHRFMYRYIPENSCTLVEKCVGGSGWRQLMTFPTGDINTGSKALDIGRVDYFHKEGGSLLADHGVYEFSACHEHYHFSHYGSFTLGDGSDAITHKQGFCLQPTSRPMNNELSPMNHPYANCIDQGVAVGWLDEYNMGLECQWIDVTDVQSQTTRVSFVTNPDGMMCEGTRKFDAEGRQLFEPTEFKTTDGKPVDRPQCDFFPGWDKNNTAAYDVTIPQNGESYITQPCGEGVFGPLRNCGFEKQKKMLTCVPGEEVTLSCSMPASSASQVVRLCEASRALKTGIPCTFNESLATTIISRATVAGSIATTDVRFTCPAPRDAIESGGVYSLMTAALFPERDAEALVTCVVK